MNGSSLELLEREIEEAEEYGDTEKLQRLYLRREKLQEKQFRDSLRRRAKLNREHK